MKRNRSMRSLLATAVLMSTVAVGGAVGSSVVAGSGVAGAAQATFASTITTPVGLAIDASGNLYTADTTTGNVYEIAPDGSGGFSAPTVIATGIVSPSAVAIDAYGNVFVAEAGTGTNDGTVAEIVIDYPGHFASPVSILTGLTNPTGIAVSSAGPSSGSVYVVQNAIPYVQQFAHNDSASYPPSLDSYLPPTSVGSWNGGFGSPNPPNPTGVMVDSSGNLFFANYQNVYKFTGTSATSIASLGWCPPPTMASDSSGNIFVGCGSSAYKIASLGSGSFGSADPIGSGSWSSTGVAVDATGNLYLADGQNGGIAEITQSKPDAPTGLTAQISNRAATLSWDASTSYPTLLNYTVTDGNGHVCTTTTTTCSWTNLTNGSTYDFVVTATNASGTSLESTPLAVVPEPLVPVAPTNLSATIMSNSSVQVSWTASTEDSTLPIIYAVTSSVGGSTCTTTTTSCKVVGLATGTSYMFSVVATNASGPSSPANFGPVVPPTQTVIGAPSWNTLGVAVDGSGNLYEAQGGYGFGSVSKVTPTGVENTFGSFTNPSAVAVDSSGNVYVTDQTPNSSNVDKITPAGVQSVIASTVGYRPRPGIAVDASGAVYVTNPFALGFGANDGEIDKITPSAGGGYSAPTAVVSGLNLPLNLAVDGSGNIYVTSSGSAQLDKYTPGGAHSTIGSGFQTPAGLAVDAAGDVYVADNGSGQMDGSGTVDEINPQGVQFVAEGGLNVPGGVALDAANNLYVTVGGTSSVYKFGYRINSGLAAATHGQAYTPTQLVAAGLSSSSLGFTTKVKWGTAVIAGTNAPLPKGMKLSSLGILSGTPSSKYLPGTYAVNVQVTQTVITKMGRTRSTSTWTIQASLPLVIN